MKKVYLLILVGAWLMFSIGELFAQEKVLNRTEKFRASKKFDLGLLFGIGNSYFTHNVDTEKSFPHAEIKTGIIVKKKLIKSLSIKTGLNLGLKLRRKPYYTYYGFAVLIDQEDFNNLSIVDFVQNMDKTLNRKHGFIELPLSVQLNLLKKLSISVGGNFRWYFPKEQINYFDLDYISGHEDYGILTGFSYLISNKVSLGFDYYHGLNKIYSNYDIGTFYYFPNERQYVTNKFVQVAIEYDF